MLDTAEVRSGFVRQITRMWAWCLRPMRLEGVSKAELLDGYWTALQDCSEESILQAIKQLHGQKPSAPPTPLELRRMVDGVDAARRCEPVPIAGELEEGVRVDYGEPKTQQAREFYAIADRIQAEGLNAEESEALVMGVWGALKRGKGMRM